MIAMEDSSDENPNKLFETKQILEEGYLVSTLSHLIQQNNNFGYAVVHIFKFEDEKMVELWDLGQPIPENITNENGMF